MPDDIFRQHRLAGRAAQFPIANSQPPLVPAPAQSIGARILRRMLREVREISPLALGLAALVLVVTLAGLSDVGPALRRPLWLDEVVSQLVARAPLGVLHAMRSGVDFQPPPHYAAVGLADTLIGDTPLAARLPSLLAAALTVVLTGITLRSALSASAAFAGTLALAAHPLFVGQAVEARPYALWILASAALAESIRPGRRGAAMWSFAAAVALCWSHYFGVLSLAAVGVACVAHARWGRRLSWPETTSTALPLGGGALGLLALLPLARAQLAATSGRSWVSPGTPREIAHFLQFVWGWRPALLLIAGGALLVLARQLPSVASRLGRIELRGSTAPLLALLATAAVPWFVVLISLNYKPVMVLRYSAPAVLAMATLCALAVESFPRPARWLAVLLLARAAVFSFHSLGAAARTESAIFDAEARAVRLLQVRGIPTVSPFRHDAYRASFPVGAPAVAWIDLPDSLMQRVAVSGIPSLTRNLMLVERDFGRAVRREFGFPAVVRIEQARMGGVVGILREPQAAAADSLWFPGRISCDLTPRLVVLTPPESSASCVALRSALQGAGSRR